MLPNTGMEVETATAAELAAVVAINFRLEKSFVFMSEVFKSYYP
jgi:hypothetical protein